MDALDGLLILMICGALLPVIGIGAIFEYMYEKREQRALHRHVWGNVVDLKDWKATQKRASGIRR